MDATRALKTVRATGCTHIVGAAVCNADNVVMYSSGNA